MKADKTTVANLQASAQMLATIAEQYRVDCYTIKMLGVKWLAHKVHKWYEGAECQLGKVLKRILYLDTFPSYRCDAVASEAGIDDMLATMQTMVYDALSAFADYRKASWGVDADYTPDIYEHVIEELEQHAVAIDRERALIEKLTEPGYIGARLEDG